MQIHHVLVPVLLLGNLLSLSVQGLIETVNHCASPSPSQEAYIQAKQDQWDSNWEFKCWSLDKTVLLPGFLITWNPWLLAPYPSLTLIHSVCSNVLLSLTLAKVGLYCLHQQILTCTVNTPRRCLPDFLNLNHIFLKNNYFTLVLAYEFEPGSQWKRVSVYQLNNVMTTEFLSSDQTTLKLVL